MDTHIESASKTTSKFGKVTSTLKNVGGMLGSSLLNAGIGMLAGVAIQGVVTLIDNYIHRQEKMIAKGKEAKSSIDETFAEFSKGKNTLDTLGQSFADNADDIETTGDAIDSVYVIEQVIESSPYLNSSMFHYRAFVGNRPM